MRLAQANITAFTPPTLPRNALAPLAPGSVLASRYRVVTALAAGAMGAVYRAEDLRLGGRPRALKELLQHWGTEHERGEAEHWFRREGETLMSLQHPAIPLVHDTFSEGQRHYLVMDLVEGRSLEQVMLEEGRPGLDEARVVAWADQVIDVLSYLHSRGDPLIFRDLKPANLMITPQGQIRLIDFGIARVFTQQAMGTAIGTPGYAPPEQYQGLAEPASDLYALGATMHHLLTGRDPRKNRPFDFPAVRSIAPEVSLQTANAVDRSLALDPRARPGTAAEMRRALRANPTSDLLPKLTISGTLARSNTGTGAIPALATRGSIPIGMDPADSSAVRVGTRDVRLHPQEMTISYAGTSIMTRIDKRTIRIKNRTNKRVLCSFDADVPWLRPDRPAAWLDPHDRLELTVGITWANPPAGDHHGSIRVHGGQNTWSVPVSLRVHGIEAMVVQRLIPPLSGVAMFCLTMGVLLMALSVLGVHVLADALAWDMIVAGVVGRVILRVLRAGIGR
jgi:serine/threonine protein kinase